MGLTFKRTPWILDWQCKIVFRNGASTKLFCIFGATIRASYKLYGVSRSQDSVVQCLGFRKFDYPPTQQNYQTVSRRLWTVVSIPIILWWRSLPYIVSVVVNIETTFKGNGNRSAIGKTGEKCGQEWREFCFLYISVSLLFKHNHFPGVIFNARHSAMPCPKFSTQLFLFPLRAFVKGFSDEFPDAMVW